MKRIRLAKFASPPPPAPVSGCLRRQARTVPGSKASGGEKRSSPPHGLGVLRGRVGLFGI